MRLKHDQRSVNSAAAAPARAGRPMALIGVSLAVALLTGGLAVAASADLGIRLRDPDGFLGPSYVRLPALVLLFLVVDLLPRAVLRARAARAAGLPARPAVAGAVRERLTAARLGYVAAGLLTFYVTYVGYRNLKSYLPFLRPELHDAALLRMDDDLLPGSWTGPAPLLHELLGTTVSAEVLSAVYVFFLFFVPVSLVFALVWAPDPRRGYWYVSALCLNWALGTASYYLLPALGPIYADPAAYADLPDTEVSALQESLMTSRVIVLADPFGTDRIHGIAAFASLHVSIVLTAALVAQAMRLWKPLRIAMWCYVALTAVATIYFGWHYLLDLVGAVVIAVASVWIGAWGAGAWRRPVTGTPTEPGAASAPEAAVAAATAVPVLPRRRRWGRRSAALTGAEGAERV
ncbi:inositol phosphorylceramide synthase [Kineococcus sp. T13]|uniref:phosphatase PAP2 family protein n=1 Tax=Kineococcus vitellinus TaxID=2696565 RepID=UPI001412F630|nr:phosphatase PAP2 family protein [Kineococcus vitellinus]NAZ76372.1 inositol phosphorylceramide synthase [Kineococcus vitellinus]